YNNIIDKTTSYRIKLIKKQLQRNLRKELILNQRKYLYMSRKLQKMPRNSMFIRNSNRCRITGRSKGFYRKWGLSRFLFRDYANRGLLPGVIKYSW
ncbi:30S ribosomal protein S14, partial [Paenibacillus sp. GCM10012307]|uniref:30S ribosomal protein S14 n=1 Tax=Paenibacillus TaxID=44249 RepID=UPI001E5CA404